MTARAVVAFLAAVLVEVTLRARRRQTQERLRPRLVGDELLHDVVGDAAQLVTVLAVGLLVRAHERPTGDAVIERALAARPIDERLRRAALVLLVTLGAELRLVARVKAGARVHAAADLGVALQALRVAV